MDTMTRCISYNQVQSKHEIQCIATGTILSLHYLNPEMESIGNVNDHT